MAEEKKRTCGYCANYVPMASELMGVCRVIPGEKRGQRGKKVMYDMDASGCDKFEMIEHILQGDFTQGAFAGVDLEKWNVRVSTAFVKDEGMKSDRLIYEKHEREKKEEKEK